MSPIATPPTSRDDKQVTRFRDKLDRELKSGLVSLLLLLVIDRVGPEYGYRILRRIEELSGGELAFKEGTAYPLLHNLEKMGLVSTFWGEGSGGPPRKYYQVTELGRTAVGRVLGDWMTLTDSVQRIVHGLEGEAPDGPRDGALVDQDHETTGRPRT